MSLMRQCEYLGNGLKGNRVIPVGSSRIHCEPPANYRAIEGRKKSESAPYQLNVLCSPMCCFSFFFLLLLRSFVPSRHDYFHSRCLDLFFFFFSFSPSYFLSSSLRVVETTNIETNLSGGN